MKPMSKIVTQYGTALPMEVNSVKMKEITSPFLWGPPGTHQGPLGVRGPHFEYHCFWLLFSLLP